MMLGSANLRVDRENHLILRRLGEIIPGNYRSPYLIHAGEIEFKEAETQWPAGHFDFPTLTQPEN